MFQSSSNPMFGFDYEALIFQPQIILNIGIVKGDPAANVQFNKIVEDKWKGWLTIFTDASKESEEECVGSAVWVPQWKSYLSIKSPPKTSVFTGEAIAIYEAVVMVKSHQLNRTVIFSDSRSCLEDIMKFPFRSKELLPINLKTREALYNCHALGIEVVLVWIPGHSGIKGNEQADLCAKWAIRSSGYTTDHLA
ncbi:uncharacterized protein LOC126366541 [Pectinophora gossypiella]|uniref:uncharacterized protein LOC126366541 n=1 Tax=Pectinophora gossypiella TaxID=13191 RepID=UPI00214F1F16|nr:uncharacterized protein LOC126366541 [Pectinophora gossypiella]